MSKRPILYQDVTYNIIGAAMEVHSVLGPGFVESVYEMALARELELRNLDYKRQAVLQVVYKDVLAGDFRTDLLVEGKVIVELKAVKSLTEIHEAQLINYLKASDHRVGLLLNFGARSLEHRRRIV